MNWKAEYLRYAEMQNDYKVKELREIAEELEIDHKGYRKEPLKWKINKELRLKMEAQENPCNEKQDKEGRRKNGIFVINRYM